MTEANNEVVVFKHVCKLCSKSFPCGRSLGGHMRYHVLSSASSCGQDDLIVNKEKLIMSIKNTNNKNSINGGLSYELRENPKRTWAAPDPSDQEDGLLSCRQCGKVFQSSKALFGHKKSHSEKERVLPGTNSSSNYNYNYSLVDDSWASASNQKLQVLLDSQSDNDESTVAPQPANRLRRSNRRRPRYMGTAATSTSLSLADNTSSPVSEIDQQEQEEVALCLIMLSRDLGQRRGISTTLNSTAAIESYENNSLVLETEQKTVGTNCNFSIEVDNTKLKRPNTKALKSEAQNSEYFDLEGRRKMEISTFGFLKNRRKIKKLQLSDQGHARDDPEKEPKVTLGDKTEVAEVQLRKQLNNDSILFGGEFGTNKVNQWKRKLSDICDESGKMEEVSKSSASDSKRCRFECTTCKKVFHSYQALGGHRASHKKIKGCSFLKPENIENSLEMDLSPCSISDTKLGQPAETVSWPKKDQKHECPICFKVFLSGQALGGHKRSHLILARSQATTRKHQSVVIQGPTQEIREFLDLNLPAPIEEEASNAHVRLNPLWNETLLGLI